MKRVLPVLGVVTLCPRKEIVPSASAVTCVSTNVCAFVSKANYITDGRFDAPGPSLVKYANGRK